ncbi:MAG: 2Fe-2S iron-sulfur cluster binding domain-containing protein, partial [Chloroflexota bacterium]|nr:2Fe-2S iron-sulfur cluster binding domain-containing protein [Chloroflexota bacterium]
MTVAAGPHRVTFQPLGVAFDVPEGETLFEAAVRAGVEIDTVCGGNGSCGKCKVRFGEDPPPAKPIDYYHLTGAGVAQGYRLACQLTAERDMVVMVPPTGDRASVRILHEGLRRELPLQPNVRKVHVPYRPPHQRD